MEPMYRQEARSYEHTKIASSYGKLLWCYYTADRRQAYRRGMAW